MRVVMRVASVILRTTNIIRNKSGAAKLVLAALIPAS